jgi:hypothetical protein
MLIGPTSSALSRVISAIASPVTRRVFQSTLSMVEENTFRMAPAFRQSVCSVKTGGHLKKTVDTPDI